MYNGPRFQDIKMTEATVLDFELVVLDQYLRVAKLAEAQRRSKGLRDHREEEREPTQTWRQKFIQTYRAGQMRIVQDQVSLASTMIIILREISIRGTETAQEVIREHALMTEMNLRHVLHVRKYLKQLFPSNNF